MTFQPNWYGDPYTKLTCLWGSFNPPARNLVEATEGSKMHYVGPSPERAQIRSQTPAWFRPGVLRGEPVTVSHPEGEVDGR